MMVAPCRPERNKRTRRPRVTSDTIALIPTLSSGLAGERGILGHRTAPLAPNPHADQARASLNSEATSATPETETALWQPELSEILMGCWFLPMSCCFFAQAAGRFVGTCRQEVKGAAAAGRARSVHPQPVHRTLRSAARAAPAVDHCGPCQLHLIVVRRR